MRMVLIAVVVLALGLLAYKYLGTYPDAVPSKGDGQSVSQPRPSSGGEAESQAGRGGPQETPGQDKPSSPDVSKEQTRPGAGSDMPAGQVRIGPSLGAGASHAALLPVQPEQPLLRAQLRPKLITLLSSQMSGKLKEVLAEDGEAIAKGQILFSLDCSLPEAQLERARASKSRRDKIWSVTSQLVELKSRSVLEADVAKAEAAEAAAEVKVGEALVSRCKVAAPFDGRAGEVLARPGQYVAEGQPVMEVLSDSELEVEFVAPSRLIGLLKPGLRFPVDIDETGTSLEAQLERLGGKVDPVSQSVRVYARLTHQPPGLMAGMSGVARLESGK